MANLEKRLEALEQTREHHHPIALALVDLSGTIDGTGWTGDDAEVITRRHGETDPALRHRVAVTMTNRYSLVELFGRVMERLPN